MSDNPMFNSSGYKDETAYKAIKNIEKEERKDDKDVRLRINSVLPVVSKVFGLAGFEIVDRIALKDKATGKIYR